MALTAGAKLGPYEILSRAGAGGMGEVYKARDTRLQRTVAIKVLPADRTSDPAAKQRLEREARAVAALSHPNICPLFDIGHQDGIDYLVMEFLEGETLAQRLSKGKLPLEQALQYGIQIADALAAAHKAGIIHRDLKPGNIMVTASGVKLLDFGLAKPVITLVSAAGMSMLPTTPGDVTVKGTILGTFQYMAPEQLEGEDADRRTDIFAFGAVLYEMLAGRAAFSGKTHASLISSILKDQPKPLTQLQPLATPQLDHVIARCLAKDPEARWQDATDPARELSWISDRGRDVNGHSGSGDSRDTRRRPRIAVLAGVAGVTAGLLAGLVVAGTWKSRVVEPAAGVTRMLISTAPAERLQALPMDRTTGEGRPSRTAMAFAPDGRRMVFSATQGDRQQLYLRRLDQLTATPMPGTNGASDPFVSPDGRWVGFWSGGGLKKVPIDGGPATAICETDRMFGASWGAADMIVYSRGTEGLWRVSAAGGVADGAREARHQQRRTEVSVAAESPGESRHRVHDQLIPHCQRGTTPMWCCSP